MKFYNILLDSLVYPLVNFRKLIELGLISFIPTLLIIAFIFISDGVDTLLVFALFLFFFFYSFIFGYAMRIIHNTIYGKDIPSFYPRRDIYEGIKFYFLLLFYFMIPLFIFSILLTVSGIFSSGANVGSIISDFVLDLWSTDFILDNILNFLVIYHGPVSIFIILFLIFSIFFFVGIARYCDDFNLIRGVDLGSIINSIGFLSWDLVFLYISSILIIFALTYLFAPLLFHFIGGILYLLIFQPYIMLFISRCIGLMHRNLKYFDSSDVEDFEENYKKRI